ncbi:alkane 1-monooxygenase [Pararhizobium haloflavum]|uniref:alkane 1-monooxygenase n=1 Tax=Pararhizobium haloflavum TaxID=2037914 RepID=UPI000C174CD8|nr:alkane 1-monooxygenase [Pararhizobium haloflavum]
MIFVSETERDGRIEYRDTKRWLWLISVIAPIVPGFGAAMLMATGNLVWSVFAVGFYYIALPLADTLVGEDPHNPPEAIVDRLSSDNFYRVLLYLSIPVYYASFLLSAVAIGTMQLPVWAFVFLTLGAGISSGTALTVGHELGHKNSRADRFAAKLINALSGYGHFCIEHNRGHHVHVATFEDPASARLGESLYRFAARELPGTASRGWALECTRLAKKGIGFWSAHNDLLQGYAITALIALVLIWLFGWIMLPFLLIHHPFAWSHLTMANYVEHYGLLRSKRADGRPEPCTPRHSWNTNHIISNLMLFHLQRHSDHHANPMRPYQALRDFEDLPRLPVGYAGCFVLAAIPPIWFRLMDPKALAWADGDLGKLNVDPKWRSWYARRQQATRVSA